MAESGDKAPPFTLATDDGGKVGPATLKGKPAVLFFYPRDDTSGCTAEALAFTALADRFGALHTAVVGISPDSVTSHAKFRKKHGLTVTLASDPDHAVCEAYGVWAEKSMYGRKYMGVERSTFLLGADGKIARVWHKVKVPGHAEEVLAAAEGLS
jgi:thioredoxin-dependent peroxiredoxin